MSNTRDYWKKQKEHSRLKSEIVSTYFKPWADKIGRKEGTVYYLDLFSGRGRYEDGNPSTPLLILDQIANSPGLAAKIKLVFYESDKELRDVLVSELRKHSVYEELRHKPEVHADKITAELAVDISRRSFERTYTFIDPFGYSDISLDSVDIVTKRWGCDTVFLLSISGLIRNIPQAEKWPRIKGFFGEEAFERLRSDLDFQELPPDAEERIWVETEAVLRERGYRPLRFLMEFDESTRSNYYLIFLSKSPLGFRIMRDIMIARGIKDVHGIPSLVFSSRTDNGQLPFSFVVVGDGLDRLSAKVMSDFAGQTVPLQSLLDKCLDLCYPYSDANVRKALEYLKSLGMLAFVRDGVESRASKPKKGDVVKFVD